MQIKQIELDKIEPAFGYEQHSPALVERVRNEGWDGIPPVPVVELPEERRKDGKEYFQPDGHHRHNAAILTGADTLKCIIYDETDNPFEIAQLTGGEILPSYSEVMIRLGLGLQ